MSRGADESLGVVGRDDTAYASHCLAASGAYAPNTSFRQRGVEFLDPGTLFSRNPASEKSGNAVAQEAPVALTKPTYWRCAVSAHPVRQ